MARKIALISCTSKKINAEEAVEAKDLYAGTMFKLAWEYANKIINVDQIYILSAKHHLLNPDVKIEVYNHTLVGKKVGEIKEWSEKVLEQLKGENIDFENDEFYILAGKNYHKYLVTRERFKKVVYPYAGCRGIGYILKYLKEQLEK